MDLFDYRERYPNAPGFKRRATSRQAAEDMKDKAPSLRDQCFSVLCEGPHTADQVAEILGKSVLTIRPRLSELVRLGCIRDTGRTAPNASGKQAAIWEICGANS
jgi:predicted HTH transcriptional regulator